MPLLKIIRDAAEKIRTWSRRADPAPAKLVRARKPNTFRFGDDGLIPNHPTWPLVIYRGAVRQSPGADPAAVFETLFKSNGWGDAWRDGIYDYVHYHSAIHEVLGIARGHGDIRFGGAGGRTVTLKAGDVAILPAGTGHQRMMASADFLVVGAYPDSGTYDECTTSEDHERAVKTIPQVKRPATDPVYGAGGPLLREWIRPR